MVGSRTHRADGEHLSRTYPTASARPDGLFEIVVFLALGAVAVVARGLWRGMRRARARVVGLLAVAALVAWWSGSVPLAVIVAEFTLLSAATLLLTGWWRRHDSASWWRRRTARDFTRDWPVLCDRVGLMVTDCDRRTGAVTESTPGLSGLAWSPNGMVLTGRVALVPGQLVEDLTEVAERLSEAVGAHRCRITRTGPAIAELTLLFADPLLQVIAPMAIPQPVDLTALPVGVREDGQPWLLRLIGTHVLVVGVTGAGKGSVIWSLLRALAPCIAQGTVQVWAVDGKAGMELAPGRALFTRFATTVEDAVVLLEEAIAVMTQRAAELAGHTRLHAASVEQPLLLVLVDEVALLTAYQPDRKLRDRAEKALATIATQGRAPGVVLVAALQDPRKEVLGLRNLFPTKIAMRLDEKAQVNMVLGDGAREAGAVCDRIPETLPGLAYVKIDGQREPARVRAAFLDDDHLADLSARYPAP